VRSDSRRIAARSGILRAVAQNAEIIRAITEPFAGVDLATIDWRSEALSEALDDRYTADVELRTLESGLGSGVNGGYRGLDGFIDYLEDWLGPFREYHVEWLDFIEVGDFVLVPTHQWGIGSTSGARAELDLVWVYELRDGKVARAFQYDTLEQAREAVPELT
jgi:ketosteroid isomerase-like protein